MSDNKVQIKAIISGKVQGVFYRFETKNSAAKLGIKGYVKNLPNGSVEAVFEGESSIVNQMLDWCNKGPSAARVENIQTEKIDILSNFETFNPSSFA